MVNLRHQLLAAALIVQAPVATAQSWRDYFDVKTNEFSTSITLAGKPREGGETGDRHSYMMFGTVTKKTGETAAVGIGLLHTYRGRTWRQGRTAATSHAEPLRIERTGQDVRLCRSDGCFFDEHLMVYFTLPALQQAAKEPTRVRLGTATPNTEFIFEIDPKEAQALLDAIAETSEAQKASQK